MRIRAAIAGLALCLATQIAHAQIAPPGFQPGFRSGFKFVSGSVPWTPLNISSAALVAWWDPTQGIALNGSNVSAWADRVGGLAPAQAIATQQPEFSATARNGKPGLVFNSANSQFLNINSTGLLPTGTVAITIAVAAFYNGTPAAVTRVAGYGSTSVNGAARLAAISLTGFDSAADVIGSRLTSSSTWANVDSFVEAQFPSGTGSQTIGIYADGNAPTTGALTLASITANATAIGAVVGGGTAWNGAVQQVLIISGTLSTSERQKLEGWESWTDGKVGSNLPSGHPYKSRAPYVSDP